MAFRKFGSGTVNDVSATDETVADVHTAAADDDQQATDNDVALNDADGGDYNQSN